MEEAKFRWAEIPPASQIFPPAGRRPPRRSMQTTRYLSMRGEGESNGGGRGHFPSVAAVWGHAQTMPLLFFLLLRTPPTLPTQSLPFSCVSLERLPSCRRPRGQKKVSPVAPSVAIVRNCPLGSPPSASPASAGGFLGKNPR